MTTIDNAVIAERVAKARAELILSQTFYGVLVSQVQPIASTKVKTMATNGKTHWYNPGFIAGLTQTELLGVQAHETEHDARRHHTRRNGRDPDEWNIACDYAINIDLVNAGFTLPKGALIDARYEGWSAEDIYRARELDKQQQQQEQQQQPQDGDDEGDDESGDDGDDSEPGDEGDDEAGDDAGDDAGDEAGDDAGDEGDEGDDGDAGDGDGGEEEGDDAGNGSGEGEGDESGDEAGDDADGSGTGDADGEGEGTGSGDAGEPEAGAEGEPQSHGDPGGCGEVLDAPADSGAELADEDAKWERVLRQAAMLASKRGDAPGHISREIERADHPPQDWRETLRAFFDGGATTRETWSRPNRRFIGSGLYLPGREREGVNRAAILVDTSGSMDVIALAAIGVEIQAALDENVIDEVVVIYGDTRVTRVDTYRSGDDCEFDPRGGGGTVLKPLFDHVRDEVDASLIVCFTDGDIDITSESPEPACPVLWAFTGYPDRVKCKIANAPWGATAIDVGSH